MVVKARRLARPAPMLRHITDFLPDKPPSRHLIWRILCPWPGSPATSIFRRAGINGQNAALSRQGDKPEGNVVQFRDAAVQGQWAICAACIKS